MWAVYLEIRWWNKRINHIPPRGEWRQTTAHVKCTGFILVHKCALRRVCQTGVKTPRPTPSTPQSVVRSSCQYSGEGPTCVGPSGWDRERVLGSSTQIIASGNSTECAGQHKPASEWQTRATAWAPRRHTAKVAQRVLISHPMSKVSKSFYHPFIHSWTEPWFFDRTDCKGKSRGLREKMHHSLCALVTRQLG